MSGALYFDDVEIGQSWISPSRTITETDVINFAGITGDFNPLHVDQQFASGSHFGQRIAHGLLGLSWVAGLGSQSPFMKTVAFLSIQQWTFLKPLVFGDTVHVRTEIKDKSLSGRRYGRILWQRSLINQRGETVQQGIFETVVETKAMTPRPHMRNTSIDQPADLPGGAQTTE
jgi:acyl dehydratase